MKRKRIRWSSGLLKHMKQVMVSCPHNKPTCRYLRRDSEGPVWCYKSHSFYCIEGLPICKDYRSLPWRLYHAVVYAQRYNQVMHRWELDPDETAFKKLEGKEEVSIKE